MDAQTRPAWERLGRLLIERRARLNPRYATRKVFAEEASLNLGLIRDIETAQRDTFTPSTIATLEQAYQLAPGAIGRALAGGELEEAPQPGGLPSLSMQAQGTVGREESLLPDDELRATLIQVARRLSTDDLRAVLREKELGEEPEGSLYADPDERRIMEMDSLSPYVRHHLVVALHTARALETKGNDKPDAEVYQFGRPS
ncbi:hypothetical protein ACIBQX_19015 [Nonomuraea sp. NPDC049714]|uniref:hypothetical protein n=1 Tax=Nonomuraea sp. NPDC049714 TaxID=3364357 RepID=UPI0037B7A6A6